jgi:hypothetical protein
MKLNHYFFLLTFIISPQSFSSEIDNFTDRYIPLTDSTLKLQEQTRDYFEESVAWANKKSRNKRCDEKKLYRGLKRNFWNHMSGEIVPWITHSNELDIRQFSFKKSIYRDFNSKDAFLFHLVRIFSKSTVEGVTLQVGSYYIGSDKFEHFFAKGYAYFEQMYLKNNGIHAALKIGHDSEAGSLGLKSTGVYSHADLVANFNGMRFWNHILQKNDDILGVKHNLGPYVKCHSGSWVIVKNFKWQDYMDDSWDEAINCSKFGTQSALSKVLGQVKNLENTSPKHYQCPIMSSRKNLKTINNKYQKWSKQILNFSGHTTL